MEIAISILNEHSKMYVSMSLLMFRRPVCEACKNCMQPFILQFSHCTFNRILNCESEIISMASAAVSAASFLLFSNTSIAMYTLWKSIEVCFILWSYVIDIATFML